MYGVWPYTVIDLFGYLFGNDMKKEIFKIIIDKKNMLKTVTFMLSMVKMPLKGEVGGRMLNDHGNYIVDHGKILEFCF